MTPISSVKAQRPPEPRRVMLRDHESTTIWNDTGEVWRQDRFGRWRQMPNALEGMRRVVR